VTDALAWFDSERLALMSGVAQACRHGLDELAWELSARAVNYYAFRGHYGDWSSTHGLALRACGHAGNRWGEAVMTRNLACLRMTGLKTPPGVAAAMTGPALATFQQSGERHGAVDLLSLRAFALRHYGDPDQALAQADAAMATAEHIGYELAQCRLWYLRAVTRREQGRYEDAAACAERCLDLAVRVGGAHDRTLALWELAAACRDRVAFPRASHHLREGLKICRRRRERLLEAYLLLSLGDLHLRFGHRGPAELVKPALAVFHDYAVPFGRAVGLRLLGECHRLNNRPDQAVLHLTEAVRVTRGLRNPHEQALALRALGSAHQAGGDRTAAEQAWQEARRLFLRIANAAEAGQVSALLARRESPATPARPCRAG
jgi:tetratricopeptide (TPR) repeat protein